jgi:hypothetical protein
LANIVQNINKNPAKRQTLNVNKSKLRKSLNLNKDIFFDNEEICNIDLDIPISPHISKMKSIFSTPKNGIFVPGRIDFEPR